MRVLILGANSDIGIATARAFAVQYQADIYLASRDTSQLETKASDIKIRYGVDCSAHFFDADKVETHKEFYEQFTQKPDVVIVAFGLMGEQLNLQKDSKAALEVLNVNFRGAVSISEIIANDFEANKTGTIIGISSVAGERGRASNYIYGASKAGFTAYLSGLRNRLFNKGVSVITILPGFVDTKMTVHLTLPKALLASPEEVASSIIKGFKKKKNTIYVKPVWKWIMLIITNIPEFIFKRLSL